MRASGHPPSHPRVGIPWWYSLAKGWRLTHPRGGHLACTLSPGSVHKCPQVACRHFADTFCGTDWPVRGYGKWSRGHDLGPPRWGIQRGYHWRFIEPSTRIFGLSPELLQAATLSPSVTRCVRSGTSGACAATNLSTMYNVLPRTNRVTLMHSPQACVNSGERPKNHIKRWKLPK